ncbi:major facilitator superfamily domain-containing protein [Xylogone sp. PMI_703]|nr:major facilitator superfamily domain-containing protein [Xylogone sp. PMI_703]
MISNILSIAGGFDISRALGVEPGPGKANWNAASYQLTQGTFVLASGSIGAVYGHRNMVLLGGAWLTIWSLVNGFCNNFIAFNVARAMSGIGGALIMPNAVAMIGISCPPGKLRNLSLGFFGAANPISGGLGAIFAGAVLKYTSWKWIFFIMAIIGVITYGSLWFFVPPEHPVDPEGKIDWVGAALASSGLIIFSVAWNQSPAVGWSTPYEIALLVLSIVLILVFLLWEGKFATTPIVPLTIWKAPSFLPLILVVLFTFMAFGNLLWYMIAWQQVIRHWSVLRFGVGWIPFSLFGAIGAILAGWLVPRLAAQWILTIGSATVIISLILVATMPDQQTYWAQVFPATIIMAFCPDLVYTAAQIIASNSVSRSQQGTAASLVSLLLLYGTSLGLGFAGTVEIQVNKSSTDVTKGYRAALYFSVALAVVAMVFNILWVRMAKDEREGWQHPEDLAVDSAAPSSGISNVGDDKV